VWVIAGADRPRAHRIGQGGPGAAT
jgi:hypothetical protein